MSHDGRARRTCDDTTQTRDRCPCRRVRNARGRGAPHRADAAVNVGPDDIGGVVTGPNGPEAGVWVIAETTDLPTKFVKIVVTDDRGRYSSPTCRRPTTACGCAATGSSTRRRRRRRTGHDARTSRPSPAPNAARRGGVLPGRLLVLADAGPGQERVPGHRARRATASRRTSRARRSSSARSSRARAPPATSSAPRGRARFPPSFGKFAAVERGAWERRVQSGQAGAGDDRRRSTSSAASARSRCSPTGPTASRRARCRRRRPGRRGSSATSSSRSGTGPIPKAYLHDVVSTDRRNPTVNANGPLYGALELSADYLPVLDPMTHTSEPGAAHRRAIPNTPSRRRHACRRAVAVLGRRADLDEQDQRAQPDARRAGPRVDHLDGASARQPGVLQGGLDASVGEAVPAEPRRPPPRRVRSEDEEAHAHRHLLRHAPPDVRRGREQHAVDERRRAGGRLAEHEDVRRDGRRGEVAGMDARSSSTRTATASATSTRSRTSRSIPTKDKRINAGLYSVAPAPDGSVWGSSLGFPGGIVRLTPGANPPETALAEYYEPPYDNPKAPVQGFSPRGMDIDRNGVAWVALASGHMASFDRRKCKGPLNGPTATGQHCPEGWTLYTEPLPQLKGVTDRGQRRGELLHVGRPVRHARPRRRTRRSTPATRPRGCSRSRTASGSSCACRIRWASTPSGWTAASTTRTRAGRAAGSGRRSARARRSTWRRARGRRAR